MSKRIDEAGLNKVNVVGKLVDIAINHGTSTTDGRNWESAKMTLRVTQSYGGREETSDIPVSIFAYQYTNQKKLNPGWTQLQALKTLNSAQTVGINEAATVRLSSANIRENNFPSRSGQVINGWQISGSFAGAVVNMAETASFALEIYIMDMQPEEDRDSEPTGRLLIKGAVVQYGQKLDVLNFIVEQPDNVQYIEKHWEINSTVMIKGRIRVTTAEAAPAETSWGEDVPETSVRTVRELIITTGDDEPRDEDMAYDSDDIKKLYQERKARLEQMQIDAQHKSSGASANVTTTASKYSWN